IRHGATSLWPDKVRSSVPVCLPGGAALAGATDPTRGYVPVAGQGAQHRLRENPSYITVDK
ncbi:hypothetical protein EA153_25770, partial [Klebsiella pneumoniae]